AARQVQLTTNLEAARHGSEEKCFSRAPSGRGFRRGQCDICFAYHLDRVRAAGEDGVFVQPQEFKIFARLSGREQQQPEGVAVPAVVAEPALETLFLGASLLMDGDSDRGRTGGGALAQLLVI